MRSKSCTAEILISAKSKRVAAAIRDALLPDLSMLSGKGESAEIILKGSRIFIRFESNDTSTLRANINSALLLAVASYRCLTL
ncbi:MAG TPA: KEOPS complex subunit Pcc1 [Nitrososphaera sp.]|nr:KEOPS complex subunit Pcc1 [Nitrososphaera sp.]